MLRLGSHLLFHKGIHFSPDEGGDGGEGKDAASFDDAVNKATSKVDKNFKADGDNKDEGGEEDESSKDGKDEPKDKTKGSKKDEDEGGEDEDEEDDEADDEDELDAQQVKYAKQLFRALNNPNTSKQALLQLARAAGLDLKEATVEEKKEFKKGIKEIFKSKLGPEYKFLADKIGEAVEESIKAGIDEGTKELRERAATQEAERVREKVSAAKDKVFGDYEGVTENAVLLKEVKRVMSDMRPGKGTNPETYFRNVLQIAASNKGIELKRVSAGGKGNGTSSNSNDRNKKNHNDASSHLASGRGSSREGVSSKQVKTIDDAIAIAVKKADQKFNSKEQ